MGKASRNFARRKIYFLRIRRFCRILQSVKTEGLLQQWLGPQAHALLASPEDFRTMVPSGKLYALCAMWHLMSKHKFHEAARLLAHSIHAYPMSACWLWRTAFHLFRNLDASDSFRRFNDALDQFRLSDENNRILERILQHMVRGELVTAHQCRSRKVTPRDRYTSSAALVTKEPEYDHVQRLQHLYEGLSLYGLWLERMHKSDSLADDTGEPSTTDDLAEKAFYRLQEVEALVSGGYLCDIFVRPLVEILEYFNEPLRARSLLLSYARHIPENPNALRYLCEWYRRRSRESDVSPLSLNITADSRTEATTTDGDTSIPPPSPKTPCPKITARLLRYRIKFSRHVLPEPAPSASPHDVLSAADEKRLLRCKHPHVSTINLCLKHGLSTDALELSFALLDHPSWAVFNEPWKLLRRSVQAVGKQSPEVVQAFSIRKRSWSQIHFKLPRLPVLAQKVRKLCEAIAPSPPKSLDDDALGPLLSVIPLSSLHTELTETSGADTST
ncbi:hypothetical protein CSKR_104257 [Clonorchis sinensis]|uniref:TATA box-binding protein-associated factor RNA polymerase I subunit A n=2 Tax=Clonorchis sinensis TaxID=79923 RepID=A0A8T1M1H8_CLOSI|nr:hypothetical protein CSKR_104257 [Clonorchis sinensis]